VTPKKCWNYVGCNTPRKTTSASSGFPKKQRFIVLLTESAGCGRTGMGSVNIVRVSIMEGIVVAQVCC